MVLLAGLSSAGAATNKEQTSHLASAGQLTDNVYAMFKLSFAIDSIQMELFTGDRDVVNVKMSLFSLEIFLAEIYCNYWQSNLTSNVRTILQAT